MRRDDIDRGVVKRSIKFATFGNRINPAPGLVHVALGMDKFESKLLLLLSAASAGLCSRGGTDVKYSLYDGGTSRARI